MRSLLILSFVGFLGFLLEPAKAIGEESIPNQKEIKAALQRLESKERTEIIAGIQQIEKLGPAGSTTTHSLIVVIARDNSLQEAGLRAIKAVGPSAKVPLKEALEHRSSRVRKVAAMILSSLELDQKRKAG